MAILGVPERMWARFTVWIEKKNQMSYKRQRNDCRGVFDDDVESIADDMIIAASLYSVRWSGNTSTTKTPACESTPFHILRMKNGHSVHESFGSESPFQISLKVLCDDVVRLGTYRPRRIITNIMTYDNRVVHDSVLCWLNNEPER